MKKVLIGLAVLPFVAAAASAAEPLTNQQMDNVTAGFFAISTAGAFGLAGESGIVYTATSTGALLEAIGKGGSTVTEATTTLWLSQSAAQSATVTTTLTPSPITCGCLGSL